MKKILILSCAGTARELAGLFQLEGQYEVVGFLDDYRKEELVLGKIREWFQFSTKGQFCSALGSYHNMSLKKKILKEIPLGKFITFVSKSAIIYPSAKVQAGGVVFPFSVISSDAILEEHVLIYHHAVVAHDSFVGNYSIVSNNACISGNVHIGSCCYIGAGATVLEGITIGDNCIIAAGATVVKDVPDNHIYISKEKIKINRYLS